MPIHGSEGTVCQAKSLMGTPAFMFALSRVWVCCLHRRLTVCSKTIMFFNNNSSNIGLTHIFCGFIRKNSLICIFSCVKSLKFRQLLLLKTLKMYFQAFYLTFYNYNFNPMKEKRILHLMRPVSLNSNKK